MNPNRCRCNFDMPGTCPGPAYCPMCQDDEVDQDDQEILRWAQEDPDADEEIGS